MRCLRWGGSTGGICEVKGSSLTPFALLCAGSPSAAGAGTTDDYAKALQALRACIDATVADLSAMINEGPQSPRLLRYGPFVTRRLIEEAIAAILARFDPARIVVAFRGARTSDFRVGDLNQSSLGWVRDVLPEIRVEAGATVWSQSTIKKSGVVRSPVDGHLASYVFETAHPQVLDALNAKYATSTDLRQWVLHLQKFDDQQGVALLADLRRRIAEAYSYLSKGIHFEFSSDGVASLDVNELAKRIADAIQVLVTCGLYSHFSEASLCRLSHQAATDSFDLLARQFSI